MFITYTARLILDQTCIQVEPQGLNRLFSVDLLRETYNEGDRPFYDVINYYLPAYNKKFKTEKKISSAALEKIQTYPYPGNVRELENIIKKGSLVMRQ